MYGIDLGWTDIYTTIRREFTTVAVDQLFVHLCNSYARYFERWNLNSWLKITTDGGNRFTKLMNWKTFSEQYYTHTWMKRNKLIYSFDVYKYKMGTLNLIFKQPLRCLNVSVLTLNNCMLFDVGRLNLIVTYIVNFFPLFFSGKKTPNKNDNLKKCISFQFL